MLLFYDLAVSLAPKEKHKNGADNSDFTTTTKQYQIYMGCMLQLFVTESKC